MREKDINKHKHHNVNLKNNNLKTVRLQLLFSTECEILILSCHVKHLQMHFQLIITQTTLER